MSKAMRTALALVLGLALYSGMAMAQVAANKSETSKAEKDKSDHHSHLGKAAFWRHHKDADKNAKHAKVTPASSKQSQNKAVQVKTASAKESTAKKQESTTKKQPKQATKTSKPAPKKAPAADKAKSEPKAQDTKTALSK